MDVLVIDNYDSFTYNLVQYLGELGASIHVVHHDAISIEEIDQMAPNRLLISPGPGRPDSAGISKDVIDTFGHHIPILGVCLGHQAIAEVFGGTIIYAPEIMHGKHSQIHHHKTGLLATLKSPFSAVRYNSLVVDPQTLPDCLEVTAWTEDQTIMGIQHRTLPIFGVY